MANTYKNIVITPNRDTAANVVPVIRFSGGDATLNTDINVRVYTTQGGTLSFEGSAGQLFSITNDLTNTIFSINDVSGIPSLEVDANGKVSIAHFSGNVGIGTSNSQYKLDVAGTANISGGLLVGGVNVGSTLTFTIGQANTARDQANAAFVQANTARDHANASFGQANTARDQANASFVQANTARDHANAAHLTANAAFGRANTANITADLAFGRANTANITADLAFGRANTANITADLAYGQANTARAHANAAHLTANAAFDQANTARTHANAAHLTANAGFDQANTARTHANAAHLTANAAFVQANTARDHANAAFNAANTAPGSGYYNGNNGEKGLAAGLGDIFRVHTNTLTGNVTINSGNNSLAAGPITIATGRTLLIQTNARVSIV